MKTLEEQLTNLSRNNGSRQYDTNVDCIINDLKKKHSQEVINLQNQYKSLIEQIHFKVWLVIWLKIYYFILCIFCRIVIVHC